MTQITKNDGNNIITFLENSLKIKMPKDGFLAGQSVCSALLYLHGKQKDFFVNDLDIFLSYKSLSLKEINKFNLKQSKMIHSMVGFEKRKDFKYNFDFKNKRMKNNLHLEEKLKKELIKNKNYNLEEYSKDTVSGLISKIKRDNTFFNKKEITFSSNIQKRIFDTTRNGIFNYIYHENCYNNDLSFILEDFDINCTQIGICLRTKRIVFTKHFLYFYNTLNLNICKPNTPYHSIIRLFKKQKEFNFNCSLELESLYIGNLLKFGLFSDLKEDAGSFKSSLYCFGDLYADKYNKNSDIINYFNLEELKKNKALITLKRKEYNKEAFDYNIYKLDSNVEDIKYISSGNHKKDLEKNLGATINGYPDYIQANLKNIMNYTIEKDKKVYSYSDKNIEYFSKFKNIHKEKNSRSLVSYKDSMELEIKILNFYNNTNIDKNKLNEIIYIYLKNTYTQKFLFKLEDFNDMYKMFIKIDKSYNMDNIIKSAIIHKKLHKNMYEYKNLLANINSKINNEKKKYSNNKLINKNYLFKEHEGYKYEILDTEYKLKEQSLYQKMVLTPYKKGIEKGKYLIVSFYKNKEDRITFIFNIKNNVLYLNNCKNYTYEGYKFQSKIKNNKKEKNIDVIIKEIIELNSINTY
jgi:hypothetical protein